MHFSTRILALKPSPTVALNVAAKAMIKKGLKVVNLSVGEPDFATPPSVVQRCVEALQAGKTKYGAPGGGVELRTAIADKMRRDNGLTFENDEIVAGVGAKEILFHISLALLNEGDEVLIPAPYWVSYTEHCVAAGAVPVVVPMPSDVARARINLPALKRAASRSTSCIVLNSPNNPAGFVYSREELEELGNYLRDKDWWIISDEIYEYLNFKGKHVSLLNLFPELADRLIIVNGLSKGFAMTGWRVGFACGPKSAMKLVENLQTQSSTCLPAFIEQAAAFALSQGKDLLKNEWRILQDRRDLMVKLFSGIENLSLIPPEGAFYLFMDIRKLLSKAKNIKTSLAFSEYLLREHQVALVPGEAFGADGFLRLSYAQDESVLRLGFERIKAALNHLKESP